MAYYNDIWGEGNVMLIVLQAFTLVQYVDSLLLMFESDVILYNIIYRIARYFFLAFAVIFNIIYAAGFINLMELIYSGDIFEYDQEFSAMLDVKSDLTDKDTWAIYDMMAVMVTSYFEGAYFPTFIINMMIITKEFFED